VRARRAAAAPRRRRRRGVFIRARRRIYLPRMDSIERPDSNALLRLPGRLPAMGDTPLTIHPKKVRARRRKGRVRRPRCGHLRSSPSPVPQGEPADLVTPLKAYLDVHYAGRDAVDAAEDLAKIAAMRSDVVANAVSTYDARRDLLVRCVPRPRGHLPLLPEALESACAASAPRTAAPENQP